jgi:hypothetical protein
LILIVVGVVAGAVSNLTGWFDEPTIIGKPRPTYTPPLAPVPDGALAVADLIEPAWAGLAGAAQADWAGGDAPRFQLMADTLASHWRILTGPNPLARIDPGAPASASPSASTTDPEIVPTTSTPPTATPGTTASASAPAAVPGEPVVADNRNSAISQITTALAAVSQEEWSRAAQSSLAEASWWTGLAGATDQVQLGLNGVYNAPTPPNPTVTVAPATNSATALNRVAAAYDEAIFIVSGLVGQAVGNGVETSLTTTWRQLESRRDAIVTLAQNNGWTVDPPAAAYKLPTVADDQAALTAAGQAIASISQAVTVWLATASDQRTAAIAELQAVVPLGQGYVTAIWVGWPD